MLHDLKMMNITVGGVLIGTSLLSGFFWSFAVLQIQIVLAKVE